LLSEFPNKQSFKLLYQASEHGFSARSFHAKCDNVAGTLTLIKTTRGYIFGGCTRATWTPDAENRYKQDNSAYIFSLKNKDNCALKIKIIWQKEKYAICCMASSGPVFGCGYDIYISNNCNTNTDSVSNLGNSYSSYTSKYNPKEFLAGAEYFQVAELEVYQII
jgi:hypothetical protein